MPPPPNIDRTAARSAGDDRTETLAPRPASTDVTVPSTSAPLRPVPRPDAEDIDADDPERYEQIREHARGGLGRVVRALDRRLGRTVAVKELLRKGPSTAANEARFLREALITARLEHPGIVPVHEAGRWPSGDPYYVMKLVEGRTLKELITSKPTLRDRLGLLPHVIAIADAVGYAHSEGVIHRDLKPSNVIVGEFGETIVVDWGLARDRKRETGDPPERALDQELLLAAGSGVSTVSGKVVGTPAYMAPEQARGELVDERADVYAIGAVLYELLAGIPPHHDDTPQATLDRVIAGPPRPVALMAPHVPSELATIVTKAMARCPEDRYPNATALAEDLRRYQTGQLVSAHSYTTWSLIRKKLGQHRGVVAVAVASAIALAGVGVESFRRVVDQRNIARSERAGAVEARAQAENRQRELVLLQAVTALPKDPTATIAWLKTYEVNDADRGRVQDIVDEAIAAGVARHVFRPGDWVYDAAFTPDGKTVVAAVRDGYVRAYDLGSGTERALGKAESAPEVLALSPDGSFAITGGTLGEVTIWPLHGGAPKVIARGPRGVIGLALSPDRTRVLVDREVGPPEVVPLDGTPTTLLGKQAALRTIVASQDWTRRVVVTSPNQIAAAHDDALRPLAQLASKKVARVLMSPRGDVVLVHDGSALWKIAYLGGTLIKVADYDGKIADATWSPDERTVALSGERHDVMLVDLIANQARELRGHTDAIYTVEWTHDGRRLLSASDDGTARVWTIADGTSVVLRGHDDDVYRARFSDDERQVVTSSLDGSIRVWSIEPPGARTFVEGAPIDDMTVHGDLALIKTTTEVARWNLGSGHREPLFSWDAKSLSLGLPSPDGERLIVPHPDWSLEVRRRNGPAITLRGHKLVISRVEFSRDGKQLYTSSFDGTLRRWDLDTGAATILIDGKEPVTGFAIAADGRVAAQVGDRALVLAPDGHVLKQEQGGAWCVAFAEFEKVRDRLLLRRCDNSLAILDGDRLVELPTDNYHVSRLAVSPDGTRIAGALGDRTVRVWDAMTGRVLRVLRGHTDLVLDVAFSPDGTTLASSAYDKTVRVWDLASERHRVLRGHTQSVHRVVWRDPTHLATASRDGTIRIWDVPAHELPTTTELAAQLAGATSAQIDIDRPTTGKSRRRGSS